MHDGDTYGTGEGAATLVTTTVGDRVTRGLYAHGDLHFAVGHDTEYVFETGRETHFGPSWFGVGFGLTWYPWIEGAFVSLSGLLSTVPDDTEDFGLRPALTSLVGYEVRVGRHFGFGAGMTSLVMRWTDQAFHTRHLMLGGQGFIVGRL